MQIWKIDYDVNKYNVLTFTDTTDLLEKSEAFNGSSKIKGWDAISFKRVDNGGSAGANAFGSVICMPIVDEKVLVILCEVINDEIEVLPISLKDNNYLDSRFYIINVVNRITCIDFFKTKYTTFASSDRILSFEQIVFSEEKVKNQHMFMAEYDRFNSIYISNTLKELLDGSDIQGFMFELVWDSKNDNATEEFQIERRMAEEQKTNFYLNIKNKDILLLPKEEWIVAIMTWLQGKVYGRKDRANYNIETLPLPCQLVFAIYILKWEVENGGYNQFFYNFGADLGRVAKRSLEQLGLQDLALITEDAIETWEELNIGVSPEDGDMESFMKTYANNPLSTSDGYFNNSYSLGKLDESVVQYIEKNIEYFGD